MRRNPNARSDVGMTKSERKTRRKRRRIKNKRLRHLKPTRKGWKIS